MSWSVSSKGNPANVKVELESQFSYPLADAPAGLPDEGERETVRRIRETIFQCLETFGAEVAISVIASGHMGYRDWDSKSGAFQNVDVSIHPAI